MLDEFGDEFIATSTDGYHTCEHTIKPRVFNKFKPFNTFLHYSEHDTRERTVFGLPASRYGHKHLEYTYSDRLYMEEWGEGLEAAIEQKVPRNCARYFEIGLEHVLEGKDIDLQHVILGVNTSTGFSYLIFGYTSTERNTDETHQETASQE